MLCFRLFSESNPAVPLADAVAQLREGQAPKDLYAVEPASFQQIPNAPFAYWVSERIRRLFVELPAFEGEGRSVKQGLATADDFRFTRLAGEAPLHQKNDLKRAWIPFAKGGSFAPYYADVPLLLNWLDSGKEIVAFTGSRVQNTDFYFLQGIVFPRRTKRFCPRPLPRGTIFSNSGQVAFAQGRELPLLALLYALPNQALVFCSLGANPADAGGTNPQFEVGVIQKAPIINSESKDNELRVLAHEAWSTKRRPQIFSIGNSAFHAPALAPGRKLQPTR
jgi:hypothetical protein